MAYTLLEGRLSPEAFTPKKLQDERYLALREKVKVERHDAYGTGPFARRGSIVSIRLKDGSVIQGETDAPRWKVPPADEELIGKFRALTHDTLSAEKQQFLVDFMFCLLYTSSQAKMNGDV